mmetsp:Transcript_4758/g.10580  ORF Transcript_4758/g.10580 Transcript_4758/m.10580 type:complete len:840 (+) Transcript_4758:37-2556(+)
MEPPVCAAAAAAPPSPPQRRCRPRCRRTCIGVADPRSTSASKQGVASSLMLIESKNTSALTCWCRTTNRRRILMLALLLTSVCFSYTSAFSPQISGASTASCIGWKKGGRYARATRSMPTAGSGSSVAIDSPSTTISSRRNTVFACGNGDEDGSNSIEAEESTPLFVDMTSASGGSKIGQSESSYGALEESFDRVRQSLSPSSTHTGGSEDELHNDGSGTGSGVQEAKRINLAIVERGQRFAAKSGSTLVDGEGSLTCKPKRVPGCVATVHVKTTLVPLQQRQQQQEWEEQSSDPSDYRVILDGDADALLSMGLLALLSDTLAGESTTASAAVNGDSDSTSDSDNAPSIVTARDVLSLDPKTVADMLGLRTVLSTGRNDGLASMTNVIQDQVRSLLHPEQKVRDTVSIDGTRDIAPQSSSYNPEQQRRPTVAMLLSGGVDSSVALNLLVRQNYNVTAFYLKIWLEDELSHLGQCPWENDYNVCKAVCEQAGVPLETVSLQHEYKDRVISYTVDEARKGRTPNPDIMCNSRVKFGCFYDAIDGRGFDYVASGHYAQLEEASKDEGAGNGHKSMRLLRAPDPVKDQTYFLCALSQDQLSRVKFPIGSYRKSQVRDLAHQFNLPNRNRPDSQGLCFLGKVKFDEFINAYLGTNPGDIEDATTGRVIGRHNGLWFHTVGQRKGIGKVLNPIESSRGPWYIVAKDCERNVVIASNEYDQEAFDEARSDFYAEDITWIAGSPPSRLRSIGEAGKRWKNGRFTMKIRHGPTMVNGTLTLDEDGPDGTVGSVRLDNKDKGLAPGQYCVFYNLDDEECLGAGVISERHWARLLKTSKGDVESPAIAPT